MPDAPLFFLSHDSSVTSTHRCHLIHSRAPALSCRSSFCSYNFSLTVSMLSACWGGFGHICSQVHNTIHSPSLPLIPPSLLSLSFFLLVLQLERNDKPMFWSQPDTLWWMDFGVMSDNCMLGSPSKSTVKTERADPRA